jgi:hypothetical protein
MKQADLGLNDEQLQQRQTWLTAKAADLVAELRLMKLLKLAGEPRLFGSYDLGLMVWPDIDIEVAAVGEPDIDATMTIAKELLLKPEIRYVHMRHQTASGTDGGYKRLFIGMQAKQSDVTWQIDISIVDQSTAARTAQNSHNLKSRLTDDTIATILRLKQKVAASDNYHGDISSMDLYTAVLDKGVVDIAGFEKYLTESGKAL